MVWYGMVWYAAPLGCGYSKNWVLKILTKKKNKEKNEIL